MYGLYKLVKIWLQPWKIITTNKIVSFCWNETTLRFKWTIILKYVCNYFDKKWYLYILFSPPHTRTDWQYYLFYIYMYKRHSCIFIAFYHSFPISLSTCQQIFFVLAWSYVKINTFDLWIWFSVNMHISVVVWNFTHTSMNRETTCIDICIHKYLSCFIPEGVRFFPIKPSYLGYVSNRLWPLHSAGTIQSSSIIPYLTMYST